MQLGFVSAILPELDLSELFSFAADVGFDCVEVMCWPAGKEERRYAGVSHIDASDFDEAAADRVRQVVEQTGVSISGLGYYPNPLSPNREEAETAVNHIRRVIRAAAMLGIDRMNTFVGRDPSLSVEGNWPRFLETWRPIVGYAQEQNVRIGIENCPMSFTEDEWPGGKNLATSPAIWRRMFEEIDSPHFGLNFDPSHFVWQHMDYVKPLGEFRNKLFHIHAKDARIDQDQLDQVGSLAYPNLYHTPKLPGLGDVDWGRFFSALTDAGYDGPVCVEVEDRAYEGSLEARKPSLIQSINFLRNYIA